jgi:hypothetical protein
MTSGIMLFDIIDVAEATIPGEGLEPSASGE